MVCTFVLHNLYKDGMVLWHYISIETSQVLWWGPGLKNLAHIVSQKLKKQVSGALITNVYQLFASQLTLLQRSLHTA